MLRVMPQCSVIELAGWTTQAVLVARKRLSMGAETWNELRLCPSSRTSLLFPVYGVSQSYSINMNKYEAMPYKIKALRFTGIVTKVSRRAV